MKKVLIAVEGSRGSLPVIESFSKLYPCIGAESVILLFVETFRGAPRMDEMLGKAEMEELKKALKGTEFQEKLDKSARAVLNHFKKSFKEKGVKGIKCVIKKGHPADEILETAEKEGAEMIVMGSRGQRMHTLMLGSVSREVVNRSNVTVLIAR